VRRRSQRLLFFRENQDVNGKTRRALRAIDILIFSDTLATIAIDGVFWLPA
jgi:hypothetical protein